MKIKLIAIAILTFSVSFANIPSMEQAIKKFLTKSEGSGADIQYKTIKFQIMKTVTAAEAEKGIFDAFAKEMGTPKEIKTTFANALVTYKNNPHKYKAAKYYNGRIKELEAMKHDQALYYLVSDYYSMYSYQYKTEIKLEKLFLIDVNNKVWFVFTQNEYTGLKTKGPNINGIFELAIAGQVLH